MSNPLYNVADFIYNFKLEKAPSNVEKQAILSTYNAICVSIGASKNKQVQDIISTYCHINKDEQAQIWGHKNSSLFQAIFINALMGHTLELDDVHVNSKTHIGTVVVPAAWTLAAYLGLSGKELLEAVICGYEVTARIGMAFNVSEHRNLGWHVSSTAGVFGSAAACAKLLKLNKNQTLHALLLAGAQSFGTWAFLDLDTTSKVLNPARAAQSGCEAAFLAKSGMLGSLNILTSKDGGLFTCMTKNPLIEMVDFKLGEKWEILEVDNKPYPSCRSSHFAIECALYLRKKYDINYQDIQKIEVFTYLVGYKQCGLGQGSKNPKTVVEAKFSIPYTVAVALIDGEVTLKHFLPSYVQSKKIDNLLQKIEVFPSEKFSDKYPKHWGGGLKIYCKNNQIYTYEIEDAQGCVANPLKPSFLTKRGISLLKEAFGQKALHVSEKILNIAKYENIPSLI